jgi:predicted DCC family thiol-disulfide oxidoreductase YuxK
MNPSRPIPERNHPQRLLLFDGVCHMCHSAVQFVIRHDKSQSICFASLQSEIARRLLAEYGYEGDMKSVVYIEGTNLYTKSDALIQVGKKMSGGWRALSRLCLLIPRFIRDPLYEWVARNRYRWFGKSEQCLLPTPDVRARFLD